MRIITADPKQKIYLGQRGENEATKVVFPKFTDFPDGEYRLLAQRNGDVAPYPVVVTTDTDNVYWVVSDADCGVEGIGKCELQLAIDEVLVKSVIYITVTGDALDTEGEPPEPYEDWVNDLYDTMDEKIGVAQQAVTDAHAEVLLAKNEVTNAHNEYLDAKAQAEAAAQSASEAAASASVFTITDTNNDGNLKIGA